MKIALCINTNQSYMYMEVIIQMYTMQSLYLHSLRQALRTASGLAWWVWSPRTSWKSHAQPVILESTLRQNKNWAVWLTVGQCQSALIRDKEPLQCLTCLETHYECHPNKDIDNVKRQYQSCITKLTSVKSTTSSALRDKYKEIMKIHV